jgi:hypothetical protein
MDISFKNNHIIYETEIRCNIGENEFNYSQNPTLQTGSFGDLKEFALDENFQPYVTTVGLYNDNGDLLAVAKLGQPLPLSANTNTCIIVRLDF